MLGRFMARAVADDILPPVYVTKHEALSTDEQLSLFPPAATRALKSARALLLQEHAMSRLDRCWGFDGARR